MERISINQTKNKMGQEVFVAGWINSRRDHGKLIFIDLRDRSGILQVVFAPDNQQLHQTADKLRSEWVIGIKGKINQRPKGMENPELETGQIELQAKELVVYSEAKTLPFLVETDGKEVSEELRLKYRYLDLRRKRMQENLGLRHQVELFMREWLTARGFIEIETPILTKSTPEGARDYVVPSRVEPGKFYALPQSPQQYKQLLMVAGFEKYFQIARCLRDEDPRGDRQPEFTQLDIEMSFVNEEEEILSLVEQLFIEMVQKLVPGKTISQIPFPRISYQEAMEKYGSDKPDLRKNKNDPNELAFGFVVDFPMFEWKETEKRWDAVHHPFTMPKADSAEDFWQKFKTDPGKILAKQYDFVLNGYEIAGGSLRIHNADLLAAVFEAMGNKKQEIENKFGHMLEAFSYGVPPHGGIAPGIDRLIMILQNEPSIREVFAFPKTGDGRDLMMGAPSAIDEAQLKELKLKIEK
ncbi:MAG: aspartate--tRNA ligase [Patescibacteria group bacterium]